MDESDVITLAQDLIRIDSSNYGDVEGPGERDVAEYVATYLSDLGLSPVLRESEPRRTSLTALWEGEDRSRPPLVVHGHLDVVPAFKEDWTVDPFGAEIKDGMIWGRGAVDMKGIDAMYLAAAGRLIKSGRKPARDIVLAFFADEEHGGARGAKWLASEHRDDFHGATEAISEVGGFSIQVRDKRVYLIQTAEKGIQWLRLVGTGRQGHGSFVHEDNAVTHLAGALARIGTHEWPTEISPTVERLLRGTAEIIGVEYATDPNTLKAIIAELGSIGAMVDASIRNTSNPTMMDAGYKTNVIPDSATGFVDTRFLAGHEESMLRTIEELAGTNVKVEQYITEPAIEAPFEADIVDRMIAAVKTDDPDAVVLPYSLMGGTDNKHLAGIGINGYGFAPLRLPQSLEFSKLFHGIDERVPVESLTFGTRVMEAFLTDC